jgi:hypothetical protein
MTISLAEAHRRAERRAATASHRVERITMSLRIPIDIAYSVSDVAAQEHRTIVGVVTQALTEFLNDTPSRVQHQKQTEDLQKFIAEVLFKHSQPTGDDSFDRGVELAKQACIAHLQRILGQAASA